MEEQNFVPEEGYYYVDVPIITSEGVGAVQNYKVKNGELPPGMIVSLTNEEMQTLHKVLGNEPDLRFRSSNRKNKGTATTGTTAVNWIFKGSVYYFSVVASMVPELAPHVGKVNSPVLFVAGVAYDIKHGGESFNQALASNGSALLAAVLVGAVLGGPVGVVAAIIAGELANGGVDWLFDNTFPVKNDQDLGHYKRSLLEAKLNNARKKMDEMHATALAAGRLARKDPLIIDLDGDGLETLGINGTVMFDHDGDGTREGTGWVKSDDGFLVFDRNNDGIINNGNELFGDNTKLYNGSGNAKDAFEALAQEDTNGDGVIDALDANWDKLGIWRDLNQDGISQSNELFTLEQLGIVSINTDKITSNKIVGGGVITGQGSYTKEDGTTGTTGQIDFNYNPYYREYEDKLEIPEQLQGLPNVEGSGAVRDLLEATTLSGGLKNALESYSTLTTRDEQMEAIHGLLYSWANTSGMTEKMYKRFGMSVVHNNIPGAKAIMIGVEYLGDDGGSSNINEDRASYEAVLAWEAKIHILEAFNGQYFFALPDRENSISVRRPSYGTGFNGMSIAHIIINWTNNEVDLLSKAYDTLVEAIYEQLLFQTRLAPLVDMIELSVNEEKLCLTADFSKVFESINQKMEIDQKNALTDLIEFQKYSHNINFFSNIDGVTDLTSYLIETVNSIPLTDELKELYANLKLNMYGLSSYKAGGTADNDFIIGGSGNDILTGGNGVDYLYGQDGNDTLNGGSGNDILDGGAGDDILNGGLGNNTYVFGKGYGHDIINTNTAAYSDRIETILLKDLNREDITFGVIQNGSYQDFVITINETGETIKVNKGGVGSHGGYWINAITFADGTTMSFGEAVRDGLHATDGDDVITLNVIGGDEHYTLYGGKGNDTLKGNSANDQLFGEDGNDTLSGEAGNDILDGGAGDDILNGGLGNNTYVFGKGYGHDIINTNTAAYSDRIETILLKDLNREDITFGVIQNGSYQDFVITINETGETIKVNKGGVGSHGGYWINAITFADGTTMSFGEAVRDGLHATDGDDVITLNVIGGDEHYTLYGGKGNDTLKGNSANDQLFGEDGNDTLSGEAGNDILDGGAGDDILNGGLGNNTYVFGKGYGHDIINTNTAAYSDRIETILLKDLNREDITFGVIQNGSYQDFVITINETGETIKVNKGGVGSHGGYWINAITFADGTTMSFGEAVRDGLHATDGDDVITLNVIGGDEHYTLYGGKGNDTLKGNSANDQLFGEDGNDTLSGEAGNDILDGGAGDDILNGGLGNNTYVFGKGYGHDIINTNTAAYSDRIETILLKDLNREDITFGVIQNGSYQDFVITINETGETIKVPRGGVGSSGSAYWINAITFADGTSMSFGDAVRDGLHATDGDDVITLNVIGGDEHYTLYGGKGNDTLKGNSANDQLFGEDGNDTLSGEAGNDILDGGAGDDILNGGLGNNTYVFGKGYGHDIINTNTAAYSDRIETILLKDLNREDITFGVIQNGSYQDFVITINETGETIKVPRGGVGSSGSAYWINAITFADGTSMSFGDAVRDGLHATDGDDVITLNVIGGDEHYTLYGGKGNDTLKGNSANDQLFGEDGNDTLSGEAGNDILDGGAGDDILNGGVGSDTYIFAKGYGHDKITDYSGLDSIRLVGLTLEDVEFSTNKVLANSAQDFVIKIKETGETITVISGAANSSANTNYQIENIEFADGSVLSFTEALKLGLLGSDGDDNMDSVYGFDTTLYGGKGNDTLKGNSANDQLFGEDGNDTLSGEAGNDILDGGAGDDILNGGAGDDIYIYGKGYGNDWVFEQNSTSSSKNTLKLVGLSLDDIELSYKRTDRSAYGQHDLYITIKETGEHVVLGYALGDRSDIANQHSVQFIEFGDASRLSFNDFIKALPLNYYNSTSSAKAVNLDTVLSGTDGADALYGGTGNDILDGGVGDDILNGGAGDDIYIYGKGYGNDFIDGEDGKISKRDIIKLKDLNLTDVEFISKFESGTYHDLIIRIKETGETLEINRAIYYNNSNNSYSIEAIEFADGSVLEWNDLVNSNLIQVIGTESDDTIRASRFNTTLYGGAGNDILYGNSGNDILDGGAGNDKLYGGAGNDTYIFGKGYGHDYIDGEDGKISKCDIIKLKDLNLTDVEFISKFESGTYHDLIIRIKETGETLEINRAIYYNNSNNSYSIEAIEFADGSVLEWNDLVNSNLIQVIGTENDDTIRASRFNTTLYGGDGNDVLHGNSGNDILDGGAGNDKLYGGDGNDTYIFGKGYGHDYIDGTDNNVSKRDIIKLKDLNLIDVEFISKFESGSYHDLIIRIKETGETLEINGAIYYNNSNNAYSIEAIEFADGSVLEWNDLVNSNLIQVIGTENDDTIRASRFNTTLYGGDGNDVLHGNSGNDILDGGAGNDKLYGGDGNDTYIFGKGYGHDYIDGTDNNVSKRDIIKLKDLNLIDVEFISKFESGSYHDLIIRIKETGETLEINGAIYYNNSNNAYSIEAIEFADGSVLEWNDLINSNLIQMIGTENNDTINASRFNTTLYGGNGNDTLNGGTGNDILDGGAGNDKLYGGGGDDTYVYGKGHGNDWIFEQKSTSESKNVLKLVGLSLDDIELSYKRTSRSSSYGQHDLFITIKETGEYVALEYGLSDNPDTLNPYAIQFIELGDGTKLSFDDFIKALPLYYYNSTASTTPAVNLDTILPGTDGVDNLYGGSGNDILDGGKGDDRLYGGGGNDILDGGTENDYLRGDDGQNTYIFGKGYGHDYINARDTKIVDDIIKLKDLTIDEVKFSITINSDGIHNLVMTINETAETLTVYHGADSNTDSRYPEFLFHIKGIEFGDGSYLSYKEITEDVGLHVDGKIALQDHDNNLKIFGSDGSDNITASNAGNNIDGGSGNDTLYGGIGNDILDGGIGDDYLRGNDGQNTYIFGKGYGHDYINARDTKIVDDIIKLKDLTIDEVKFSITINSDGIHNLVMTINETAETLTVYHGADSNTDSRYPEFLFHIKGIEFGDGSYLSYKEITEDIGLHVDGKIALKDNDNNLKIIGSEGSDNITASNAGNNIDGGAGNDTLTGGVGNDTYIYGKNYGQDAINNTGGGNDTLNMAAFNLEDLNWTRNSNHLVISVLGSEDKVTVNNWFTTGDYKVDNIQVGSNVIVETEVAKLVEAMASFGVPQGVGGYWTEEQKDSLNTIVVPYFKPVM